MALSHYLNQWWLFYWRILLSIRVTRPQWVGTVFVWLDRTNDTMWKTIQTSFMFVDYIQWNLVGVTWKRLPHYWPFVKKIQGSLMDPPHKGPMMRSFYILFDFNPDKLLNKQCYRPWTETPWHPNDVTNGTHVFFYLTCSSYIFGY